ncbi:MAG: hypothetical protein WCT39_04660 [Candidatus Margulisiibacteriota bacterium]
MTKAIVAIGKSEITNAQRSRNQRAILGFIEAHRRLLLTGTKEHLKQLSGPTFAMHLMRLQKELNSGEFRQANLSSFLGCKRLDRIIAKAASVGLAPVFIEGELKLAVAMRVNDLRDAGFEEQPGGACGVPVFTKKQAALAITDALLPRPLDIKIELAFVEHTNNQYRDCRTLGELFRAYLDAINGRKINVIPNLLRSPGLLFAYMAYKFFSLGGTPGFVVESIFLAISLAFFLIPSLNNYSDFDKFLDFAMEGLIKNEGIEAEEIARVLLDRFSRKERKQIMAVLNRGRLGRTRDTAGNSGLLITEKVASYLREPALLASRSLPLKLLPPANLDGKQKDG